MAASAKYPATEEMLRDLWDRQQISDVMLRFGRGLDLHDWDMYAATLTDPFEVDFFDLTGRAPATTTPKVWAHFASACLERLIVMHQYSNFHINLHGDVADGIFYHVSRHRFPNRSRRRSLHPIRLVREFLPPHDGRLEDQQAQALLSVVRRQSHPDRSERSRVAKSRRRGVRRSRRQGSVKERVAADGR
jgi:hypothetical protein